MTERKMAFRLCKESWETGFQAGLLGLRSICPAEVPDELAFYSGYIEGKAKKMRQAAGEVVK